MSTLLISALSACRGARSPQALLPSGDVYTDPAIGFTVEKPADWTFVPSSWSVANASHVRLPDGQLAPLLARHRGPVVAFTEDSDPISDVSPTVQILYRPLQATKVHPPIWYLDTALDVLGSEFADYEILERTPHLRVSGFPAAFARARYTLRTDARQSYDVVSYTWLVKRGRAVFTIGMSGPASAAESLAVEFRAVLSSLRIAPRLR